jgi:regulatory protein
LPRDKKEPPEPFAVALRLLARRPYSVAELRRALERRFPENPAVAAAIARLRELRYLDDRKFAEQYASSLARNKSFGRYRARRELKAKLVNYKFIEPALDEAYRETDERKLLLRVLDKKVRTLRRPVTPAKLASLCQSLLRRGFRADDIMKVVRARPELKPTAADADLTEISTGTEEGWPQRHKDTED